MRNCFIAVLLINSIAAGQEGEWEDIFNFGPSQAERIVAVHLIHVFNGTEGKVVGITYAPPLSVPTCSSDFCPSSYGIVGRNYLWTPPPPNSPGSTGRFLLWEVM